MSGVSLLLGAGTSVDAGVPTAFDLTEKIYNWLIRQRAAEPAKLYAFVVAKIRTRNARVGLSPFAPVNVEEVYDALKRFSLREDDPLNEFVAAWDDSLARKRFDRFEIRRRLEGLIQLQQRPSRIEFRVDWHKLDHLLDEIEKQFSSSEPRTDLGIYVRALAATLNPQETKHLYLKKLAQFADEHCDVVGTLNYDLLFEENCASSNIEFDYGLGNWNDQKVIRFARESTKLFKLHGSMNWFAHGDDVEVDPEQKSHFRRALIFGGQSDKLDPNGPYLQLRHEFQRLAHRSTRLGIIGYSFQDIHMNALLRNWISSKKRAKLVILDPGPQGQLLQSLGRWSDVLKSGEQKFRVEVVHIKKGAAEGMNNFVKELQMQPDVTKAAKQKLGIRTVE